MKPLVYISAPYTKGDVAENIHKVVTIANEVYSHGYLPFVPHLTHLWHLITPKPHEFWMELDLRMLANCDALLRVPGDSIGADIEVAKAYELGIPTFFSIDGLLRLPKDM